MCITLENNLAIIESDSLVYINVLEAITTKETKLITTTTNNVLNLPYDGHFKITHIKIPQTTLYIKFNTYTYKDGNFYKILEDGSFRKVFISEIVEVNPLTTNLLYETKEFFNLGNLENCLLSTPVEQNDCSSVKDVCNSNNCKRNHIWHFLNVLDYLIHCCNYQEALLWLERFNSCFGWCSSNESCHCKKCKCNG